MVVDLLCASKQECSQENHPDFQTRGEDYKIGVICGPRSGPSPTNKKIGPWVLSSFGGFHEIRWIFSGHEICLISCTQCGFHEIWQISCMKSGGFHEIQQISWKKEISKCKILKIFITFILWNKSQQFLEYR